MSDHLDGLTAKNDPRLDISDVYAFQGATGTVFVMNTNPLSGTGGFHHEAVYEFKIDITGDAREDLTLRVNFGDLDAGGRQAATLTLVAGPAACDQQLVLARTTTGEAVTGLSGVRLWAGAARDPFYIAGPVVTAVRTAVVGGSELDLGDFDPEQATNLFAGTNVQAIVVEVPNLLLKRAPTIGVWGAIAVPTDAGDDWRQTDRAAIPLTSTLFGFNEADDFGSAEPADDAATWGDQIQNMVARAVAANGYDGDAQAYAIEVRKRIVPDILHYRVGSDAKFTDGKYNGRNLVEDAAEAMFHLVLARPVDMGLDASDAGTLRDDFPYLGEPV
ncbi:DUF4331 family protein [Streptomyces halobius]|uniref:DUF4331 domain-containing protein n=1 Tax=Streptomyces halobius TaxID=2879846 RepID=A0ABY4MGT2_9ACTN|nr:DUF4331 family protein [Streptomyces halobius]UQA95620.1 DUF4331 domain-containing protein [Streptomyces halobius]